MSDTRQRLHELIDEIPAEQLDEVVGLVEHRLTPERLSEAERLAVDEAKQWLRDNGGKGIPHEVVLADLGLTMADWEKMCRESLPEESPPRSA